MTDKTKQLKPYPLRMAHDTRTWIEQRAQQNDRSINSEINRILRNVQEKEKAA